MDILTWVCFLLSHTLRNLPNCFSGANGTLQGSYSPPVCDFDHVTFNLTVVSAGKQFDRLGIMFLDNVEVFRTSTAEPTPDGIYWSYIKDMTDQLTLFRAPRRITFDLGNLVDNTYTAPFNVTLTAIFSLDSAAVKPNILRSPADLILPITSAEKYASVNSSSAFILPVERASRTYMIPHNAKKALFAISACGQAGEEFWWSNALSSQTETFKKTLLLGHSPFRELQLHIDGRLAGIAWPFPVIFTGGVVPGLWRPIVGIDTFDLHDYEIDISPWLPYLSDGKEHHFEIRVVGLEDYDNEDGSQGGKLDQGISNYWVVTGKMYLWLDDDNHVTSGGQLRHFAYEPVVSITSTITKSEDRSRNESLSYDIGMTRRLYTVAYVVSSEGSRLATWSQELTYTARNELTREGFAQITQSHTTGKSNSSSFDINKEYDWKMFANTTFDREDNNSSFRIDGTVNRVKYEHARHMSNASKVDGQDGMLYFKLENRQNATGSYFADPEKSESYSSGTTNQHYNFLSLDVSNGDKELTQYDQEVLAVNGTVIRNSIGGEEIICRTSLVNPRDAEPCSRRMKVKSLLGRGPRF